MDETQYTQKRNLKRDSNKMKKFVLNIYDRYDNKSLFMLNFQHHCTVGKDVETN